MRFGNIRVANGTLYITGNAYNLNGTNPNTNDLFILRIRNNGLLMWGNVYNVFSSAPSDEMGYDVLESMYATNEVVAVGTHDGGFGINDAYFLRVTANNGTPITGIVNLYGVQSATDEVYSIEHSLAPVMGYILCGKTNATSTGDFDCWGLRLDAMGAVNWSNTFQYDDGLGSNSDNWGSQAIERANTFGTYEFYFVGTTMNGVLGNEDMVVFKTDMNGINIPGGQFTYGGGGFDYGVGIDQNNMAAGTGLAIFGNTFNSFSAFGSQDYYFVKAYFNGVSGCNEDLRNFQEQPGPGLYMRRDYNISAKLVQQQLILNNIQQNQEQNLCYNQQIPGGSNALQAKVINDLPTQDINMDETAFKITPNPAEQGASSLHLSITAPAGKLDVIVADYMGREYINQRFDISNNGEHMLMIELGKANLAPGLYILRVNGLDKPASQVLVIK